MSSSERAPVPAVDTGDHAQTTKSVSSSSKKAKPVTGKPVSGRVWKERKTRFSSIKYRPKAARLTYEERMERKKAQQEVKRLAEELKGEKEKEREKVREKLRKKREKEQERLWEEKQKELLLKGTMRKKPGKNKVLKPHHMKQARHIAENAVNLRDIT